MSTPRTPRLRSAFPISPQTPRSQSASRSTSSLSGKSRADGSKSFPQASRTAPPTPLVPLSTLDAPTQRLYVAAVYFILLAWKLYDYFTLVAEDISSLWHFLKWTTIDGLFLYGLPALRVPWLEWNAFTITSLFLAHASLSAILMFRLPLPVEGWLIAIGKVFYDRELAISERRVKAASLLQNSSLILGKQIIHILPEGSAVLNEDRSPFCLGNGISVAYLPLRINQTVPISVELLRSDLENGVLESIMFSAKDIRRFKKEADRTQSNPDVKTPSVLKVPVKQTGLYQLGRVLDESNLEVQRTTFDALVVRCPSASMKPGLQHRCRGELSDFFIEVDATPPLRIDYTRTINKGDESSISLTWHPEDLESPLVAHKRSTSLSGGGEAGPDVSWARNRRHKISVNETMGTAGGWQYKIDKVHDGCGNVVEYRGSSDTNIALWSSRGSQLEQDFVVHQRPRVRLEGCTLQRPLRLPSGESAHLPIILNPGGHAEIKASKHQIQYSFSPAVDETASEAGEQAVAHQEYAAVATDGRGPLISEPGIYRLRSISTDHCMGEILEPSSCMLLNPPRPDASIVADEIPDKCAGHSVGILVNLDLVGTPPFMLYYSEQRRGGSLVHKSIEIGSLRYQLAFEPREAGHYTYSFNEISDSVYRRPILLGSKGKGHRLEQDIKPTAWARFDNHPSKKTICLDQKAVFRVHLTGEGPWSLEYDLIHGKSRIKKRLETVDSDRLEIETPVLSRGGTYSITLTSVTDRSGCKVFLDQEAKIEVRQEKPMVGFAPVDGSLSVRGLDGQTVRMPLRLSGDGPWEITYVKSGDPSIIHKKITSSNAFVEVPSAGSFVLQSVSDVACPGLVDGSAASFEVAWIDRPSARLVNGERFTATARGQVRPAVCEGEQDSIEVALSGNAPFRLERSVNGRPDQGSQFTNTKTDTYASNGASLKMETVKAGLYRYTVTGVGDQFYDLPRRKEDVITVEQRVNARPSAKFANIGRTYSYCKEDDTGTEAIPVTLIGKPPFVMEVGIKHQASSRPEIITFSDIQTHKYDIQVPKSSLALGGYSISILRIVDGNGCHRTKDRSDKDSVHVNVVDVPTITPLETRLDYCVGDRISYALAGTPPFNVFYTFDKVARKAAVSGTEFRRLAERPGIFTIDAVSDRASTDACRARTNVTKVVHELPSVRVSRGRIHEVDIHEGGETQILFEFGGSPPFEFTYTRSTNAAKGKRSVVLETKHDISYEYSKSVRAFEEGTYEVVAIRDKYCGVTLQGKTAGVKGQRNLT